MHTPAAYGQWSVFDHNGDNRLAVLETRYDIWWPWYSQFEVGWLQPLQLWLGAGTSLVAPVLVSQDRDLCHVQLHPTWFEPTTVCRSWPVVSYLYSGHLPVGLYLGRWSLLLVGQVFISVNATVAWYPAETNTWALVTQWPEQVHDMANKRVIGVSTLNCLQTGHWFRVDNYMMDLAHVLVVVQCITDGCSLSWKDGVVVWQSFGQLAAGCLTILEMAIDDRRCPHSLVHFGVISVDFIMWSLCFTKLIELSLGFLSGDHAFTYSFNEVVSLGIISMRSWWKVGCPQGADQFGIYLCRGHGFLYFETNGRGRGSGHASSSIWPGSI